MVAFVMVGAVGPVASGQSTAPYPELQRFDSAVFYDGLKQRGLTDLLALHLRVYPPADDLAALLLARDIKLAEQADPSRSADERLKALIEANRLLQSLIETRPHDPRARAWRMELGRNLLYSEADLYTSRILFRGGTVADTASLRPIMDRALAVFISLADRMRRDYEGLDDLPAAEYDRREGLGEIAQLERDMALVDYLLAWTRFYHGLARDPEDPERAAEFRAVMEYLEDRSRLLDTAHSATHHQAQALLLAGMTDRRLRRFALCRERLGLAIDVVSALQDTDERDQLDWVVTLARVELVRSLDAAGQSDAARQALAVFRRQVESAPNEDFGKLLVLALLKREIHRAHATRLDAQGRHQEATDARAQGISALAALARKDPAYRDEVYATLYRMLRDADDPTSLSPLERAAYLAGALGEAEALSERINAMMTDGLEAHDPEINRAQERRTSVLEGAIDIGRSLIASERDAPEALRAEVEFNLGVALFRRGRRLEAAERFLAVADEHAGYARAEGAATFAVQLAWELHEDTSLARRTEIRQLYTRSLTALTTKHPDSESARYWQFFLAQHLAAEDRLEEAADAYARVSPDHERYAEAIYLSAEARTELLKRFAAANPERIRETTTRATSAIRAAQNAAEQLARAVASASTAGRRNELHQLTARAKILTAELCVIPRVARWERALSALEGFERAYPAQSALTGRVLRTRMIALEALGRAAEASQLIPRYVTSDPEGAAPTLQGLLDALSEEIERDTRAGRTEEARKGTLSAVVIAEGIYKVASEQPARFNADAVYALRLQLAEAVLAAGDHDGAKSLFTQCFAEDAARYPDGAPRDVRAIHGTAEAHYQLGDYNAALPLFNRVFRGGEQGERIWWHALLRDLQCRTHLNGDARGIVKAIRQRKFLDREMGGPELRRRFDELLETNVRRTETHR